MQFGLACVEGVILSYFAAFFWGGKTQLMLPELRKIMEQIALWTCNGVKSLFSSH